MSRKQSGITALYERLSRDDEQFGDSSSIVNQKKMLEGYAQENGYVILSPMTKERQPARNWVQRWHN